MKIKKIIWTLTIFFVLTICFNFAGCMVVDDIKPDEDKGKKESLTFKSFAIEEGTVYGTVGSIVDRFDFTTEIEVSKNTSYIVAYDPDGVQNSITKSMPLEHGNNIFYVLELKSNEYVKTHKICIYRKFNYTVSFNTVGGTTVSEQIVEEGALAVQPDSPSKNGYLFNSWDYDFSQPVNSNLTITATYTVIEYNVEYFLDGGSLENENPQIYTIESLEQSLISPTKNGYEFCGWFTNSTYTDEINAIGNGMFGDISVYAKWKVAPLEISAFVEDGSVVMDSDLSNAYAITFTQNIPANQSKIIFDWSNQTIENVEININNTITDIYLIGNLDKTYNNVKITAQEDSSPTIHLLNFNFVGYIKADKSVSLNLNGDNKICGLEETVAISCNNILSMYGDGDIEVVGGIGWSYKGASPQNGGNGCEAVICSTFVAMTNGSISLIGGDGGNASEGTNGQSSAGANVGHGGTGGNGGAGAPALLCDFLLT